MVTLLMRYWKSVAVAIALAAAGAYRAALIHERDVAQADAQTLRVRVGALEVAQRDLASALAAQNAAVDALKASANAEAARQRASAQASARAGAQSAARADALAEQLAADTVDSDCAGAIRWGNGRAKELSQW